MALCGLLALTIGYLAGLRFRVMIVVPLEVAALAAMIMLVAFGMMTGGEACLLFLVFSVAVQAGYGLALACPLPVRSQATRGAIKA